MTDDVGVNDDAADVFVNVNDAACVDGAERSVPNGYLWRPLVLFSKAQGRYWLQAEAFACIIASSTPVFEC